MQVDWPRFVAANPVRGQRPFLGSGPVEMAPSVGPGEVRDHVRGLLMRVLRLPAGHEIDPDEGFFHMGMDSLMASELTGLLRECLPLAASLVFDASTLRSLTRALEEMLGEDEPEPSDEELALLIGEKFDRLLGGS